MFDNLSLTVPFRPHLSLESCLYEFVRPEKIDGFVCGRCSILAAIAALKSAPGPKEEKAAREAELRDLLNAADVEDLLPQHNIPKVASPLAFKEMKIVKPPQVLCLHLNRLTIHPMTGELVKNSTPVAIPEYLDITRYQHFPTKEVFRLVSVVVHLGLSYDRGHYVVYRSLPFLDRSARGSGASSPPPPSASSSSSSSLSRSPSATTLARTTKSNSGRIFSRTSLSSPRRVPEAADVFDDEPPADALSSSMLSQSALQTPSERLDSSGMGTPAYLSRSTSSIGLTSVSSPFLWRSVPSLASLESPLTLMMKEDSRGPRAPREESAQAKPAESDPASSSPFGASRLMRPVDNAFWVRISDAEVEFASKEEVLSCEAYLLFYEKVSV